MLKTQNQQLKDLIANGRIDKAIEALIVYTQSLPDQHYYNAVAQIAARWEANERANMLGTLSNDEYGKERNKISLAVLGVLDDLPGKTPTPEAIDNGKPGTGSTSKTDLWKKIGYIGLILGILASTVKIIEFCNKPGGGGIDDAMQLTVYVQGTDGKPVAEIENKGQIIVDFGNDRRAPRIGENGRSNLGEIPEKFRGEKIPIVLKAEGYEPVDTSKKYIMDGKPVYFLVRPDNSLGLIQGIVKDRSGDKFIAGALVMIDGDTVVYTDNFGRFRLQLPVAKQKDTYSISVQKDGFATKNEYFKPKTGPMEVRLDKK